MTLGILKTGVNCPVPPDTIHHEVWVSSDTETEAMERAKKAFQVFCHEQIGLPRLRDGAFYSSQMTPPYEIHILFPIKRTRTS